MGITETEESPLVGRDVELRSIREVLDAGEEAPVHAAPRAAPRAYRAAAASPARPTIYFDLASPYTYLAAERADRILAGLIWQPASAEALRRGTPPAGDRLAITKRAAELGLPLLWRTELPPCLPGPMRVASLAAEHGVCGAFVLAASRLMFCGNFDIEDPEILAEAAAAAGLELDEMLRAAGDARLDAAIEDAGRRLLAAGAPCLPVVCVGQALFCGEERLPEAAAAAHPRRRVLRSADAGRGHDMLRAV